LDSAAINKLEVQKIQSIIIQMLSNRFFLQYTICGSSPQNMSKKEAFLGCDFFFQNLAKFNPYITDERQNATNRQIATIGRCIGSGIFKKSNFTLIKKLKLWGEKAHFGAQNPIFRA